MERVKIDSLENKKIGGKVKRHFVEPRFCIMYAKPPPKGKSEFGFYMCQIKEKKKTLMRRTSGF